MMSMVVSLEELKSLLVKAIDDFSEINQVDKIPIDDNYYWQVMDDSLFDIDREKPELGIGSLQEGWKQLSCAKAEGRIIGSESLNYLAGILNWLSAQA